MGMIGEKEEKQLRKLFGEIKENVRVVFFTQEHECAFCKTTRELLEELCGLSDRLKLETHDFVAEAGLAKTLGVDKIPATVLIGDRDYGIRYYGVPAGYEFTSLVEDLLMVGRRDPGLKGPVAELVAKVDAPVHLQVLVSPTCPYCPQAVRAAHKLAMASEQITADMIEISEFPHLALKYEVKGVPVTVVNEEHRLAGAMPELDVAKAILHAIGKGK